MEDSFRKQIKQLGQLLLVFGCLLVLFISSMFYLKEHPHILQSQDAYESVDGTNEHLLVELDEETISKSGFVNEPGVSQVIQNCTQCHSAKLVTQNQMSEEGWISTITWMQETQNLWDLGNNQEIIVAYLAKNYGPDQKGRRENLTDINWYELK